MNSGLKLDLEWIFVQDKAKFQYVIPKIRCKLHRFSIWGMGSLNVEFQALDDMKGKDNLSKI